MEANHDAVSKRQPGAALKKLGDMGADIEAIVPHTPGLQGCSGHLEFFGSLTLGDALRAQLPVLLKEVRTFESIPAWLATMVDVWQVLDDSSHSASFVNLSPFDEMAKDGEVAPSFQPL
jgi:hypothetical protein